MVGFGLPANVLFMAISEHMCRDPKAEEAFRVQAQPPSSAAPQEDAHAWSRVKPVNDVTPIATMYLCNVVPMESRTF